MPGKSSLSDFTSGRHGPSFCPFETRQADLAYVTRIAIYRLSGDNCQPAFRFSGYLANTPEQDDTKASVASAKRSTRHASQYVDRAHIACGRAHASPKWPAASSRHCSAHIRRAAGRSPIKAVPTVRLVINEQSCNLAKASGLIETDDSSFGIPTCEFACETEACAQV